MKTIALVTGGNSGEAKIAVQSADRMYKQLDKTKYNVYKVFIQGTDWMLEKEDKKYPIDKNDFSCTVNNEKITFDVAFIIIHGTPGEDGKLQGYFDLLKIPYTSSDLLTSAITFNKSVCTSLLRQYGFNVANSIVLYKNKKLSIASILQQVSFPCFVKPNNGGSSIGVSKVMHQDELQPAIEKAFHEDEEVMIEDFLDGTEITCGVVQYKGKIQALAVTEIVSKNAFFDFDAKYFNKKTQEITPARISKAIEKECMRMSEDIYKKFNCKGMIRIDYMICKEKLFVIEINTIPGQTEKSLLPQQAHYAGIPVSELYHSIIEEVESSY